MRELLYNNTASNPPGDVETLCPIPTGPLGAVQERVISTGQRTRGKAYNA